MKKQSKKCSYFEMPNFFLWSSVLLFVLYIWVCNFVYFYDKTNKQYKPYLTDYIICRRFKFCENITELAQIFYFLSFVFQFFIFIKLDKNFHDIFFILYSKIRVRVGISQNRTGSE